MGSNPHLPRTRTDAAHTSSTHAQSQNTRRHLEYSYSTTGKNTIGSGGVSRTRRCLGYSLLLISSLSTRRTSEGTEPNNFSPQMYLYRFEHTMMRKFLCQNEQEVHCI